MSTDYFAVTLADGRFYTESPEDRALAYGPRLLRLFKTANEASNYKAAVDVYFGEPLLMQPTTLAQVRRSIKKVRQGIRVELCSVPKGEWPKTLSVIDLREVNTHQSAQTQTVKEN